MRLSLIPASELTDDLQAVWHQLLASNPDLASPFFAPGFIKAVAAVRDDIELAVIEDGKSIAAMFPFQRTGASLGVPAGGLLSDYQGLICAPGFECDPQWLVKQCRLSAWDFDHVLASQACFAPFRRHRLVSPVIDLSNGFQAYALERRASGSGQIARATSLSRRMERDIGPLHYVGHVVDVMLLRRVLAWKSRQYIATSKTDLFAVAWIVAMLERILATDSSGFAGMLSVLYAGDRLIAGHMGMRSGTVWHYWFPAYDRAFAKYSPGLVLLLKMAEQAPALGLRAIDLGMGMSLYKKRLMNASISLVGGSVEVPSLLYLKRKIRRRLEAFVVSTPLAEPARLVRNFFTSMRDRTIKI